MFLRFFVNNKYLNDARNIWSTIQVVTETSTQSVFRRTRSSFICGINEAHAAKLFCWTRELIQTEHCGGGAAICGGYLLRVHYILREARINESYHLGLKSFGVLVPDLR